MKISDLLCEISTFAPLSLASSWDNVGLLIGDSSREISRILISLDFSPAALDAAIAQGANLILSHHPVLLHGTKRLTDPNILRCVEHKIALIALHTNLDTAYYSVNHALADALGFKVLEHLSDESGNQRYQVSVSVPPSHADAVLSAALDNGAGRIGAYDRCFERYTHEGGFRGLAEANPYIGKAGEESRLSEEKLIFSVDKHRLNSVLIAIRSAHPYEEPNLTYFPLESPNPAYGLGLICAPGRDMNLQELAQHSKAALGIPVLRWWTAGIDESAPMRKIAICGGAGASLISLVASRADAFITGDISYHYLLDSPLPIIDAGHFYTEYPVLSYLQTQMQALGLEAAMLERSSHEFEKYNRFL